MTRDLGPDFGTLVHFAILLQLVGLPLHSAGVINLVRPSQVIDESDCWTLFPAVDRKMLLTHDGIFME